LGVLGVVGRMLLKWFIQARGVRMLTVAKWRVCCETVSWSAGSMTGGDSLEHPNDFTSGKGPRLSVMVFAECDLMCVCCHIHTHQIQVPRQATSLRLN